MRLALWGLVILGGCTQAGGGPAVTSAPSVAAPQAQAAPAPELRLFPSRRCGECHGRARDEWSKSAHAQAAAGVFARIADRIGPSASQRCAACHLPLSGAEESVVADGVGCDACHTAVGKAPPPGALVLAPEQATRFGPYRDAKAHYFHKVAYSEFVTEGGLCAACHQDPPGRSVPEYTTVAEWSALPDHVDCQTCHMPGLRAVAAKGEQVRSVSQHDFAPDKAKALADALKLVVQVKRGEATVALTNAYADHDLPTGRPERRLTLELEWEGADGHPLAHEEKQFGRVLVNEHGTLAPSFAAVREASDDRLHAGQTWTHAWPRIPGARKLSVRLQYFRFDPALSAFFGPAEPVTVAERQEAL